MDTLATVLPDTLATVAAAYDTAAVVGAIRAVTGLPEPAVYMLALILMATLTTLTRRWRWFANKDTGLFPQWGPRIGAFALAGVFSYWVLGQRDPLELVEYTGLVGGGIIGTWEVALKPIRGIWTGYIKPILRRYWPAAIGLLVALVVVAGGPGPLRAQDDGLPVKIPAEDPAGGGSSGAGDPPPGAVLEPATDTQAPERWSIARLSSGIGVNYVIYSDGLPGAQEFAGVQLKLPLVYSLSKYLAAGAVGRADFHHKRYPVTLGATVATPGSTEPGAVYSVGLGVGYTWLLGEGYEELALAKEAAGQPYKAQRMETWVNLSWLALRDSDGAGLVAVQIVPSYIPDNKMIQFAAGLFGRFF